MYAPGSSGATENILDRHYAKPCDLITRPNADLRKVYQCAWWIIQTVTSLQHKIKSVIYRKIVSLRSSSVSNCQTAGRTKLYRAKYTQWRAWSNKTHFKTHLTSTWLVILILAFTLITWQNTTYAIRVKFNHCEYTVAGSCNFCIRASRSTDNNFCHFAPWIRYFHSFRWNCSDWFTCFCCCWFIA